MTTLHRTFAFAALLVCATAGTAAAQYGSPPPPPPGYGQPMPPPMVPDSPQMFFLGANIGAGATNYSSENGETETESALSVAANVGVMVMPGVLGIYLEGWANVYPQGDFTITTSIVTVGARYYLGNVAWLQAGLGLGQLKITYNECPGDLCSDYGEAGGAVEIGAGVNLLRSTQGFALDLSVRAGAARVGEDQFGDPAYANMVSLNIGGTFWR
jgi:hypothetical protein